MYNHKYIYIYIGAKGFLILQDNTIYRVFDTNLLVVYGLNLTENSISLNNIVWLTFQSFQSCKATLLQLCIPSYNWRICTNLPNGHI